MPFLGLLLAILLGGHAQHEQQVGVHHVAASPTDTLGETTGG